MVAAQLGLLVGVACLVAKMSQGQATHLYLEDTEDMEDMQDMEDTFKFSRSQEMPQLEPPSKRWHSRLVLPRCLRTS